MQNPRLYADFQNADAKGRVRLNCNGTLEDLARQKLQLHAELSLTLYSDDADSSGNIDELRTVGIAEYSAEEHIWVAAINWSDLRHSSDAKNANDVVTLRSTRNVG